LPRQAGNLVEEIPMGIDVTEFPAGGSRANKAELTCCAERRFRPLGN
jgi:hypothetical protein